MTGIQKHEQECIRSAANDLAYARIHRSEGNIDQSLRREARAERDLQHLPAGTLDDLMTVWEGSLETDPKYLPEWQALGGWSLEEISKTPEELTRRLVNQREGSLVLFARTVLPDLTGYYTGRAGQGFVAPFLSEAFRYHSREGANRKAMDLNAMSAVHGWRFLVYFACPICGQCFAVAAGPCPCNSQLAYMP